ncbi:MAG: hypothetical protein ABSH20_08420 [Tepidisphaeraceae bacterium]
MTQLSNESAAVDEPIEQAAACFPMPENGTIDHGEFWRLLARLVQHLHRHGTRGSRWLSEAQSLDEAMLILQAAYQSNAGNGYDAAITEAMLHPQGVQLLVRQFTESFKAWQRQLHRQWIQARFVDALTWEERSQLAAILLQRVAPWLPPGWDVSDPARFSTEIMGLIILWTQTDPAVLAHSPAGLAH